MGKLIFFIPVVIVLAIVAFAFVSFLTVQTGTLIVRAESSGRYSPSVILHPEVSVGSTTQVAPFNLTLPQDQYTVVFGSLTWYETPPPRTLELSLGKTEFAVGVYSPIMKGISVTQNGFNTTNITALHGVTPVVWINVGGLPVSIEVSGGGRVLVNPSRNYTVVFSSTGTFTFSIPNTEFNGTVRSL